MHGAADPGQSGNGQSHQGSPLSAQISRIFERFRSLRQGLTAQLGSMERLLDEVLDCLEHDPNMERELKAVLVLMASALVRSLSYALPREKNRPAGISSSPNPRIRQVLDRQSTARLRPHPDEPQRVISKPVQRMQTASPEIQSNVREIEAVEHLRETVSVYDLVCCQINSYN
jgi:hypothetical protein